MRAALFALPLLPALACAPEDVPPDVVYNVTVKSEVDGDSLVTTCIAEGDQAPVFEQVFRYELYFSGSTVDLRIDGEGFAAGTRSGCDMEYESAVWLEERDAGDVRWSLPASRPTRAPPRAVTTSPTAWTGKAPRPSPWKRARTSRSPWGAPTRW